MLPFIKEEKTVWENLQAATKPIVLYGMGNGADRILDKCIEDHIEVVGVFASDAFVRGQTFRSYPVVKYQDMVEKYGDFVVVIAFASESPQLIENFKELDKKHETYAPHIPLFQGDEVVSFSWLKKYEENLTTVYNKLADDKSREVFADVLNYKLSGKLSYLWHSMTERKGDLEEIFSFSDQETYVDLGAYDGDTVKEFLELAPKGKHKIFALEPDGKNFKKLEKFQKENSSLDLTIINKGIWDKSGEMNFFQRGGRMSSVSEKGLKTISVISLDDLLGKEKGSYIKMDVEGAEKEALIGGRVHIERDIPKMFIAAYHRDNDLWEIPLMLWEMAPYRIFTRRHPYLPAWEINFLCEENKGL